MLLAGEFASGDFDDFGILVGEAVVGVAGNGGDWSDVLEFEDDPGQADISGVEDVINTLENIDDFFVPVIVRVGDDADFRNCVGYHSVFVES